MDQDIDEPWPIEVYDHAGKAYNVTMKPGEMVLYESHTVLHGRPFPLKGKFYANIFIHFQPVNHEKNNLELAESRRVKLTDLFIKKVIPAIPAIVLPVKSFNARSILPSFAGKAIDHKTGGHEQSNHAEEAILKHLTEHDNEHGAEAEGGEGEEGASGDSSEEEGSVPDGRTRLHIAAALGDLDNIEKIIKSS